MFNLDKKIKIKHAESNKRLDIFLTQKFPKFSRSQWQKIIKAGEVLINDKKKMAHYFLRENDVIKIKTLNSKVKTKSKFKILNPNFKLIKIVKKEKNYLIINKPAGIVVHPDNTNKNNTLADWLINKYPRIKKVGDNSLRPGIIHRLDKDVSGLMVVALNQKIFENLKKQFQKRKILKEYIGLVHNQMKQEEGEIKLSIKRSKSTGIFVGISDKKSIGKKAVTKYEVIKKFRNFTLLKIKILTGRTHQIRVHLRSIGHPVVGDKLYITHDVKKKKPINLSRLFLFASKLGFKDLNNNYKEFSISMPRELKKFLEKIK